ncbi:MAG TPA: hypothetical protein VLC10_04325 [Patescibacteria group bacterium]|nr:hypothetical protein [Patescibacteria group bacterium]
MQQRHDEHKRHIALWVAVGGTMAAIVTLWVLILPLQLRGMHFSGAADAARWNATRGETTAASFEDVLAQQRRQLDAIEKNTGTAAQAGSAALKIDELRAKIEAASKKNEAAPATNEPANP